MITQSMIDTEAALRHFKSADPLMYKLGKSALQAPNPIAIPKPRPSNEYFGNIARSIVSQQISTKAAAAVNGRVKDLLSEVTPTRVAEVDFDTLKACGLSQKKTEYLKHNAYVWSDLPTKAFATMEDEEIIKELTKLYGIGRWTAEMFLMFSLARPNVFSYGDLGLMNSLYKNYGFYPHYTRKISTTVDSWAPHKTLASLVLWHSIDNGPVLL